MTARIFSMGTALLSVLAASGCKGDKFSGELMPVRKAPVVPTVQPTEPPPPQIPTGSMMIGCATQKVEAPLGNTVATGVSVALERLCPDEIMTSQRVLQRRQADVVFVLDVTKSMQANIDTVKENIVEFASRVGSKGWDARFAAVAFRDPPESSADRSVWNNPEYELIYITNFMDEAGLRSELSSGRGEWIANDRSDNQEGGQFAINAALNLLRSGRRSDAEAIMLYVSDAPAFRDKDHWDFTVQETAARMATLPSFRFFHSTLDVLVDKYALLTSDSRWRGSTSFRIAKTQIEEMRRLSGKPGGWLRFPLDRETFLNNFVEQFDTVWNKVALDCFVQEASLTDASGNVVDVLQGGADFALGTGPLRFGQGLRKSGTYQFVERRCCARKPIATVPGTCEKSREARVELVVQ